jgi:hypothetical protein
MLANDFMREIHNGGSNPYRRFTDLDPHTGANVVTVATQARAQVERRTTLAEQTAARRRLVPEDSYREIETAFA